jgi:phosphatidylinositol glycan class H protein
MPLHLISRRPSTTTASFTVSNASRHTSTAAKLFFYSQFLARAIVFAGVLFYHAARFRHVFFVQDGSLVPWIAVWASPLGSFVCRIADTYNFACISAVSAIVIYAVFRKGYTGLLIIGAVL